MLYCLVRVLDMAVVWETSKNNRACSGKIVERYPTTAAHYGVELRLVGLSNTCIGNRKPSEIGKDRKSEGYVTLQRLLSSCKLPFLFC